ncbi:MAG: GTPase ObgE [Candidatus Lambdaproteobacteria bacterium]|nr:GTPase ObgE [Candidatus Lambdaproteobacteria bacterium]
MKFVDYVKVCVRSGDGGNGCLSFRREKFIPRGGPDGGNGGRGGHVVVRGTHNKNTLLDFRFRQHIKAGAGGGGMGKDRHGRNGEDTELEVPLGTIVRDAQSGAALLEVLDEVPQVLLHGGRGGFGNSHFKSSTNRAPRQWETGSPGEERWVVLELKLLADVGLVGFPNAGKSTLISRISRARPKIADYPFTTLTPNLGVVQDESFQSFVMADIPGIIRGAHEGQGLGHRFLRHIERTTTLLLLIDVTGGDERDPLEQYRTLLDEMALFSAMLTAKPRAVALTKLDLLPGGEPPAELVAALEAAGERVFGISAVSGLGLPALVRHLGAQVRALRAAEAATAPPRDAPSTPRS